MRIQFNELSYQNPIEDLLCVVTDTTTVGTLVNLIRTHLTQRNVPLEKHPIGYHVSYTGKYFLVNEDADKTLQELGIIETETLTDVTTLEEIIQIALSAEPAQDDRLRQKLSLQESYAIYQGTIEIPSLTDTQIAVLTRVLHGNTNIKSLELGEFTDPCTTAALRQLLLIIKNHTNIQELILKAHYRLLFQNSGTAIAELLDGNTQLKILSFEISSWRKEDTQRLTHVLASSNFALSELYIQKYLEPEELKAINLCLDTNNTLTKFEYYKNEQTPGSLVDSRINKKLKQNEILLKNLMPALTSSHTLFSTCPTILNVVCSYLKDEMKTFEAKPHEKGRPIKLSRKRKTQPMKAVRIFQKHSIKPSSKTPFSEDSTAKLDELALLNKLAPEVSWVLMINDDDSENDDSYYAHCPSESLAQQLVAALNQFFSDCFSSIRAEYQVIQSRPAFILKDTSVKSLQLLDTTHLIGEFSRLVDTYQVEKTSAASIKIPKL